MNTRLPTVKRSSARRAAAAAADRGERPDRKQAILLAAEKLFAQHGYHAVSIRQIADEAGVPLALVGYYYGPKNELFHAIFAHWNHTIEERLAELAAVNVDPADARTLPRIIEAFTGPVLALRASAEGEYYALLVARELYLVNEEADLVLRSYFDPLAHAFIDALHRALPHATRGQVAWGYQFALGALLHHLIDTRVERLSRGENRAADPAAGAAAGELHRRRPARGAAAAQETTRTENHPTETSLMERRTLLFSALGAACSRRALPARAQAPTKIVFGYTAVTDFASVFVAQRGGLFQEAQPRRRAQVHSAELDHPVGAAVRFAADRRADALGVPAGGGRRARPRAGGRRRRSPPRPSPASAWWRAPARASSRRRTASARRSACRASARSCT